MDSRKLEAAIARYQKMSAKQVDIELRDAGIDPRPTIEAVKKLIHRAEAARRLHHPQEMNPCSAYGRMAGSKAA